MKPLTRLHLELVFPTLAVAVALFLVGVVVYEHRPASSPATAATTPAEKTTPVPAVTHSTGFPAPPKGAVVYSREDGADALALAVVPGSKPLLQASLVSQIGKGVVGVKVAFTVAGRRVEGIPCGPGCYSARVSTSHPTSVVTTVTHGAPKVMWRVTLPATWPPPNAAALVQEAATVWRNLTTLVYEDRLGSNEKDVAHTRWEIVAPDRLAYQEAGGPSAVVIGEKRWDRFVGQGWQESAQNPALQQPVPFWSGVEDAHLLGAGEYHGTPVWTISFFDPNTPAWFEIRIDRSNMRTLDLHMNTTAHFMHDSYSGFDKPLQITPPTIAR